MKRILVELYRKFGQTSGERNEIDEIFAPILLWLRIYGLQILDPNWSFMKNSPLIFISFSNMFYVFVGTYVYMKTVNDILLFTEGSFTMVTIIQFYAKMAFLFANRSIFCFVYSFAKTTILGRIKEVSPERAAKSIKQIRKMVKTFIYIIVASDLNFIIPCLWNYFHGIRINLSRSTSTLMRVTSPYFELGVLLHVNHLIFISFGSLMIDLWYMLFLYLYCEGSDSAVDLLKVEKVKNESGASYACRLNQALRRFYKVHVNLVEYLNILNHMYKWQLLIPLATAMSTLCIYLLVISEELNFQLTIVMCPICLEVFVYNILAENIKTKASELNMALLHFDWLSMRPADRKSYYNIICYMNKDLGIKTALGIELSLITISSIIKASYQTYAILNTMKS